MPATALPRIIQLQDGTYATPDGRGGWAPYTGDLPGGGSAAPDNSFKVGDSEAINHAWDVVGSIDAAQQLSAKPLATGTMAASITGLPVIGGIVGQNRSNLQTKLGQIAGDLRQLGIRTLYEQTGKKGVGSVARNQAEQQALQSSLAPIGFVDQGGHVIAGGAQPDAATLNQGLETARSIYYRHLSRLYGLNPDDPRSLQIIQAAAKDQNLRANLLSSAQAQPTATGSTPTGGTTISTGGSTVTIDPKLAAIKPQLESMLSADPSKVSNDQIISFMKSNGIADPMSYPGLAEDLKYRTSPMGAAWRAKGRGITVDPRENTPLTGFRKLAATVSGAKPLGIPVGAAAVGAGDVATLGLTPDIAGVVHGVTGAGPTRADVIAGRDLSANENPGATFLGNMAGAVAAPFARGGGILRSIGNSALYGFAGSSDPALSSRLINAGISGTTGGLVHGAAATVANVARPIYAAGRRILLSPFVDAEKLATDTALNRAANAMPTQDMRAATADYSRLQSAGANPPAAAVTSRAGQDFLANLAATSPAAKTVAEGANAAYRKALPQSIAEDFNSAIRDVTPANGMEADMLNKPVRKIASDVQDLAGREYEAGMRPIANEPVKISPELADTLTHERVNGAIRDALSNHQLDDATRAQLRALPGQLKALGTVVPGGNAATQAAVRAKYAEGIPLSVSGARNIATALDRTAAKLQEGSEGAVELRRLSREIRNEIGTQYPEFQPVNERYASRQRAIDVLDETRKNFLNDTPEGIDALAKTARNYSDAPNPAEYKGVPAAEPNGQVLPSNRQFAIAGAREAAATKAGAGTGAGGTGVAQQLAIGPNQQARTAMVMGNDAAANIAARAGAKAQVSDVLNRIASGPNGDQTVKAWGLVKRALMYKLTGGSVHYAAAHALAGIPGMSNADAARVVSVYLNADSADKAFSSLSKVYGAQRARTIMARMVGVATAASTQHTTPIGSPTGE